MSDRPGPAREARIRSILAGFPEYRARQSYDALFSGSFRDWEQVTTLPGPIRELLAREVPWNALRAVTVRAGAKRDTWKALLEAEDGSRIETVLMKNSRGQLTVCVSTQVGCAMRCRFCATGKMGFTRNLTVDEIVDQVRFLREYTSDERLDGEITNVVFMGMGEPLANYDHVKASLRILIDQMGIGPTRITVSTVGLVPMLENLLDDTEWPPVRIAVSLHSADPMTREAIMPTSYPEFLDRLAAWTDSYFQKFAERRRHLTFEYIVLAGVNDSGNHACALIRFARRVGKVRINLIPYNYTDAEFKKPSGSDVERFQKLLTDAGVVATRRRTMGDDIAAACGQLAGGDR